jgi:hypothetical protein
MGQQPTRRDLGAVNESEGDHPARLVAGVDATLDHYLPRAPRAWACAAASVFAAELQARGASPHRLVAEDLARAWGLDERHALAVGSTLDVVQVAIDVADNLADEEEDAALGRNVQERYAGIPRPFLLCLPAALLSAAQARLVAEFSDPVYDLERTLRRMCWALAEMAEGQAATEVDEKIRLTSGKQGLLLCLPAWLTPDLDHPIALDHLEHWATAFGRSWEHQERLRGRVTVEARQAWFAARFEAEQAWPRVYPFDEHGPLARERLLAPMMC